MGLLPCLRPSNWFVLGRYDRLHCPRRPEHEGAVPIIFQGIVSVFTILE